MPDDWLTKSFFRIIYFEIFDHFCETDQMFMMALERMSKDMMKAMNVDDS